MTMTTSTSETVQPESPDLAESLQPVLPQKFALGLPHLFLVAALALLFMLLNYSGLRPTDLWCHVAYGQWILTNESLPQQDPFMPLSVGMQVTNSAWLSQVLLATLYRLGGPELLSTCFAVIVLASYVILSRIYYVQTRHVGLAAFGIVLTLLIGWSRLLTIRPEVLGFFSFCLLLWITSRLTARDELHARWPRLIWCVVPVIFVLWANLHGSFVCGLVLLGCYFLGCCCETLWRRRSIAAVWQSVQVRRWLVITELAVLACLINPYGMHLLTNTLLFSGNLNLQDILEWQSLSFTGVGGIEFAVSVILVIVVFRHSRRRVRPTETVLLAVFSLAALSGVRMLSWYAPVIVLVLMPHIADIAQQLISRTRQAHTAREESGRFITTFWQVLQRRSFKTTAACGLAIWIAFALSPSSQTFLGGPARTAEQVNTGEAPLGVSQYLRENPPEGQIWNPQYWGDFLLTDASPDLSVFCTTMIHLVPRQVWQDYSQVYQAGHGWQRILERYRVNTVVIDKERQETLAGAMRRMDDWQVAFEDDQSLVVVRQQQQERSQTPGQPAKNPFVTHTREVHTTEAGVNAK